MEQGRRPLHNISNCFFSLFSARGREPAEELGQNRGRIGNRVGFVRVSERAERSARKERKNGKRATNRVTEEEKTGSCPSLFQGPCGHPTQDLWTKIKEGMEDNGQTTKVLQIAADGLHGVCPRRERQVTDPRGVSTTNARERRRTY